jgi:3-dehydroquinate dehydratase type I
MQSPFQHTLSICVAIPTIDIPTAIATAQEAVRQRAQYIEYRVDYAPNIIQWTEAMFRQLISGVSVPVILTMRMKAEGGQQELEEATRIEILKRIIAAQPAFVDLEVRIAKAALEELYLLTEKFQVKRIYSLHNFEGTPNDIKAETLLNQIKARCPGLKRGEDLDSSIIKLVFYARCERDNLIALELCRNLSREHRKSLCFCMGEKGVYSRVMCLRFGALFAYASITDCTAPGQISIHEFYQIMAENEAASVVVPDETDPECLS